MRDNSSDVNIELHKMAVEQHKANRESLLANEAFTISMQQVVAGGLLIGCLTKLSELFQLFGGVKLGLSFSLAGIALVAAVLAAQFRHDYRMWDVKAAAASEKEAQRSCFTSAGKFLRLMRRAMWTATACTVAAVVVMVGSALTGNLPAVHL